MNTVFHIVPHRKKRGMTLVETMVTVTILATFTAGAAKVLLSQRKLSDTTRGNYKAIHIAKNRLEEARTFDFSLLENLNETAVPLDDVGDITSPDEAVYLRYTLVKPKGDNLVWIRVRILIRNRELGKYSGDENQTLMSYIALHPYLGP